MGDAGSLPKAVTHQALPVECGHGWKARAAGSALQGRVVGLTLGTHSQARMGSLWLWYSGT